MIFYVYKSKNSCLKLIGCFLFLHTKNIYIAIMKHFSLFFIVLLCSCGIDMTEMKVTHLGDEIEVKGKMKVTVPYNVRHPSQTKVACKVSKGIAKEYEFSRWNVNVHNVGTTGTKIITIDRIIDAKSNKGDTYTCTIVEIGTKGEFSNFFGRNDIKIIEPGELCTYIIKNNRNSILTQYISKFVDSCVGNDVIYLADKLLKMYGISALKTFTASTSFINSLTKYGIKDTFTSMVKKGLDYTTWGIDYLYNKFMSSSTFTNMFTKLYHYGSKEFSYVKSAWTYFKNGFYNY